MKTNRISPIYLALTWMLFSALVSLSTNAELLLNGLSASSELGQERFVAGLYTDRLSKDGNDLLRLDGQRRMELKITARRFSARNLNSMWIQGMAINNPDSVLQEQGENITQFSNMIRKALVEGDVLILDAEPGKGLTVTLNDTQLGNIASDEFFSVLLSSWIGAVPLSSEFKKQLLSEGKIDSALSGRYQAISPSATRIQSVANWVAPTAPPAPVAVARTPTPRAPRPAITLPNQPTLRPSEIAAPTIDAIRENPERIAAILPSRPDRAVTDDPSDNQSTDTPDNTEVSDTPSAAIDQGLVENTSPAVPTPTDEPTQVATTEQLSPADESPFQDFEEEEEEALFTMESILGQTRYVNQVVRHATKFQKYPISAARRGQQGSVRLSITVDRSGDVVGVQTIEESRYRSLNKEALSLVKKASPFPEVPTGVGGETYTFSLPVVFRLE